MRLNAAAALAASALLAGTSLAQEEAEAPIASSVAERPTFTVTFSHRLQIQVCANTFLANHFEGALPRTVHRRLGIKVDTVSCKEGGLQNR